MRAIAPRFCIGAGQYPFAVFDVRQNWRIGLRSHTVRHKPHAITFEIDCVIDEYSRRPHFSTMSARVRSARALPSLVELEALAHQAMAVFWYATAPGYQFPPQTNYRQLFVFTAN